jgi:hypothetical protein
LSLIPDLDPTPFPTEEIPHIASHRHLVDLPVSPEPAPPVALDAVIVPASRADAALHHAAGVARRAGCPLLVLCSKEMTAAAAVAEVQRTRRPPLVVAVDVEGHYGQLDLKFRTDSHTLATHGRGDASHKRNIGVLVAQLLRWRSVLFLDDDVVGMDDARLTRTRSLLGRETPGGRVEAVGWSFEAFADNSVVCHAHRSTGGHQDVFIGGGGLAVRVHEGTPFFPNVYNEDWLFLFDLVAQGRVLLAGGLAQLPYDPFDHAERAEYQEFGDLFAESLLALLHHPTPRPLAHAAIEPLLMPARRQDWWRERIDRRARFIASVDTRCAVRDSRMVRSLRRAHAALELVHPLDLVDFVDAWRADLATWHRRLTGLPHTDLRRALDLLELEGAGDVARRRGRGLAGRVSGRVAGGSRAPSPR